jgi:hypothetical protein
MREFVILAVPLVPLLPVPPLSRGGREVTTPEQGV